VEARVVSRVAEAAPVASVVNMAAAVQVKVAARAVAGSEEAAWVETLVASLEEAVAASPAVGSSAVATAPVG